MLDKAKDLGRLIGQTEEFKALRRARQEVRDAPALTTKLDRLQELAVAVEQGLGQGQEPSQEQRDEYERLLGEIQSSGTYQRLVAAQSNFDKLMHRVNEQIAEGMEQGAASSIITLS